VFNFNELRLLNRQPEQVAYFFYDVYKAAGGAGGLTTFVGHEGANEGNKD